MATAFQDTDRRAMIVAPITVTCSEDQGERRIEFDDCVIKS
jgi:hypothetical protein